MCTFQNLMEKVNADSNRCSKHKAVSSRQKTGISKIQADSKERRVRSKGKKAVGRKLIADN